MVQIRLKKAGSEWLLLNTVAPESGRNLGNRVKLQALLFSLLPPQIPVRKSRNSQPNSMSQNIDVAFLFNTILA
jgi:hypothetical protein